MQVTNTQKGPRGINTAQGPVLIEPGQTVDVEVSEAELKVARASGWFEFGKAAAAKPPETKAADLDKLSDDELRAYLKARNVAVDGRLGREKLLEAAKAAPAEPTA